MTGYLGSAIRDASLYLVSVHGSDLREIAPGHYLVAAWSPDGAKIAGLDYSSDSRQLVVMNAEGTGQRVPPDIVPSGPFTSVAWHQVP